MKKLLIPFLFLFLSAPIFAQGVDNEDLQVIQSIYGKEKKEMLKSFLMLSDADAAKFWPVYEAYEVERKEQGKRRVALISEYVNTYGTADDVKLDKMTLESIKINTDSDKLLGKYYGKMKKAVGAKNAAKFFQFETYMLLAVRESIYDNIPFLDELDN